jgi:hypothetical protein
LGTADPYFIESLQYEAYCSAVLCSAVRVVVKVSGNRGNFVVRLPNAVDENNPG